MTNDHGYSCPGSAQSHGDRGNQFTRLSVVFIWSNHFNSIEREVNPLAYAIPQARVPVRKPSTPKADVCGQSFRRTVSVEHHGAKARTNSGWTGLRGMRVFT